MRPSASWASTTFSINSGFFRSRANASLFVDPFAVFARARRDLVGPATALRVQEQWLLTAEKRLLGEVRSLPMYEAFSGVDFAVRQVSAQAECGGMPGEHCFWDRFACLHAMLQLAEPANED